MGNYPSLFVLGRKYTLGGIKALPNIIKPRFCESQNFNFNFMKMKIEILIKCMNIYGKIS